MPRARGLLAGWGPFNEPNTMKRHVICHMMSPLDGRLMLDPWAPEGNPLRQAMLDEYQRLHTGFGADAWMAGTTTMEDFATDEAPASASAASAAASMPERPWHLADKSATRFAIGIDRKARLHWKKATADEGHLVLVFSSAVSDSHLAELAAVGVSYLVMPGDDIDLADMLEQLHYKLPIKTVLLEGGAKINGAFLKAGLVDEISLVLCPAIDGTTGGAAIFETGETGVGGQLKLELRSAQPIGGGAVHLRYDVSQR
jgi:riboflavin biosynthesis pyrimidine reductase